MSLLITSSQSKENTNNIAIENPAQYINHLRSPLEVPPGSEIAVDSVKINRNALIDYQNAVALFWLGERLGNSNDFFGDEILDTTSWPIVQQNKIRSSLSVTDFQTEYRKMLREAYNYHPEINTSSSVNGSIMSKNILTNTVLDGFKFQFQQLVGDAPTNKIPIADHVQGIFELNGTFAYDPANGSITSGGADTLVLVKTEGDGAGPLALSNGSVTFNVSDTREEAADTTRRYAVGLTRAYMYKPDGVAFPDNTQGAADQAIDTFSNTIGLRDGRGLGDANDVFFDYAAEAKDGELKLYHFVREYPGFDTDGGEQNKGIMEEIKYYQKNNTATGINNGSNSDFATGSPINVSQVTEITFVANNEKLTVVDQNGSIIVDVVKTDSASFVNQVPKPINQACWKMYPHVYLFDSGKTVAITEFQQRTGTTMNKNIFYGPSDWQARCNQDYFDKLDGEESTFGEDEIWQGSQWWPTLLERRPWGLADPGSYLDAGDYDFPKRNYKGNNAGDMKDYENIFLVGPNKHYMVGMPVTFPQPNAGRQLGMFPYSVFPPDPSITPGLGSSFTSEQPPETSSLSSAFIRLPRFGLSSFNAAQGSVSKMIDMIPRFDNAGNEVGALYFQKPEKVYLDLRNTETLNITDFAVDIVRMDETIVDDLTGTTEIVFHIRKKARM